MCEMYKEVYQGNYPPTVSQRLFIHKLESARFSHTGYFLVYQDNRAVLQRVVESLPPTRESTDPTPPQTSRSPTSSDSTDVTRRETTSHASNDSTDVTGRGTTSHASSDSTDVTGRETTSHAENQTEQTADPEERPTATVESK